MNAVHFFHGATLAPFADRTFRLRAAIIGFILAAAFAPASGAPANMLMPVPAAVRWDDGRLVVTRDWTTEVQGPDDGRVGDALARLRRQWEIRLGGAVATPKAEKGSERPTSVAPALVVRISALAAPLPQLGEDESYHLRIEPTRAVLEAPTTVGALRGLATLTQLLQSGVEDWFLPCAQIDDAPRFAWRGLLIDVARHWMPVDVIKRNIDGMALVKLNVLHLHLTDDQGFRIESRTHPRLHQLGSDGQYFTQDEMRGLVAYAAARGIRVVPEFDVPGHATAWAVPFPELASAPGPYAIERRWGVLDVVLDPTNEKLYPLLDEFFGEMAALFPDPYLHIGGDENNGKQWTANAHIVAFIQTHGLKDNAGLHAYFNGRLRDILQRHGKKLIGWDEILHGDLPRDSVIQSWRGATGLSSAVTAGFSAILSNGYYIDLCLPAAEHYRNDPLPADTSLTLEQQRLVLGGEATMWSEWVTPETIDGRIWPRTAAIAERLWSPRDVHDVTDMYRRLAIVSRRLDEAGLNHERNRPVMLRRFAGVGASDRLQQGLAVLVDAVEPVKNYQRGRQQPNVTQLTPLVGLADCARPESEASRDFAEAVRVMLFGPADGRAERAQAVARQLDAWSSAAADVIAELATASPAVSSEAAPVARQLADLCAIGRESLAHLTDAAALPDGWREGAMTKLDANAKPHAAVELPLARPLRLVVAAAALKAERTSMPAASWRGRVEQLGSWPATKPVH